MQPDKILHYRIEHHLGSGSFGDVYQAYDEKLERYVAVKIATPNDNEDEDLQAELAARFKMEIGATVKLIHPNIVTVYDAGVTADFLYYVMAYLPGGDLKKNNSKLINNLEIVQVCIDVAKALAYAHDMGFVHRDIKPENILFDAHNNAVVADFGIVKAIGKDYTSGRYILGTPSYSAPEQLDVNEEVDGRADLYSLGKVLYFMLMKNKYTHDNVEPLPEDKAIFSPILDKLLSANRENRFKNAHELLRMLEELQLDIKQRNNEETLIVQNKKSKPMNTNYTLAGIVAAAVIAVVVVIGLLIKTTGIGTQQKPESNAVQIAGINININTPIDPAKNPEIKPEAAPQIIEERVAIETQNAEDEADLVDVPRDAIVIIESQPSGAEVFFRNEKQGVTPFSSESMPTGDRTFTVKKRFYRDKSITMNLASKKISKEIVHLEPGTGDLSVMTEPAGARVWIAGQAATGVTPLSIEGVAAGKQTLDIRKDNMSARYEIEVEHGQVTLFRTDLAVNTDNPAFSIEPIVAKGMVLINTNPPGADVYLNGKKVGTTPYSGEDITVGIHSIRLSRQFYSDVVFEEEFAKDTLVKKFIDMQPGSGSLSVITAQEGASVWLNGKLLEGTTPLSLNDVPAGKHLVDVRKGNLRLHQEIIVDTNAAVLVDGDLVTGALIAVDDQWLSIEELIEKAGSQSDKAEKIKIYRAILEAESTHETALNELDKLKTELITELERLKDENKYIEARKIAKQIVNDFGKYFELPELDVSIDQHERDYLDKQLANEFARKDQQVRSLIKMAHYDEANTVLKNMPEKLQALEGYGVLQELYQKSLADFQKKVIGITGPLVLVKVDQKKYLRAFAYEVTFKQWDICHQDGDCSRKPNDYGWGRGNKPVIDVSFDDIKKEFIPWLNRKTGIAFKLPTEAEWKTLYGTPITVTHRHANGPAAFGWGDDSASYTADVGSYQKNTNGLYDLNGNIWEWVDECGDANCMRRVLKGGSWNSAPKFFSKEERWLEIPAKRANDIGFRLVAEYPWQL